jgi:hypothetical protein
MDEATGWELWCFQMRTTWNYDPEEAERECSKFFISWLKRVPTCLTWLNTLDPPLHLFSWL